MFDIQSVAPTNPAPIYQQSKGKPVHNGDLPGIELEPIKTGKEADNAYFDRQAKGTASMTPSEIEMSRPPTPRQEDAVGLVQTWNNPSMNKWRILCCCMIYFGNGVNDAGKYKKLRPADFAVLS